MKNSVNCTVNLKALLTSLLKERYATENIDIEIQTLTADNITNLEDITVSFTINEHGDH